MSFYVHVAEDGTLSYPLTLTDLRLMQRNASFPAHISDEEAAMFNFFPVRETPAPETLFETAVRHAELIDGEWVERWTSVAWSAAEIEEATAREWSVVRSDRNKRLAACDWTQLSDAPLTNIQTAQWAAYRQALRDVTAQPDPFNIAWPTEPTSV